MRPSNTTQQERGWTLHHSQEERGGETKRKAAPPRRGDERKAAPPTKKKNWGEAAPSEQEETEKQHTEKGGGERFVDFRCFSMFSLVVFQFFQFFDFFTFWLFYLYLLFSFTWTLVTFFNLSFVWFKKKWKRLHPHAWGGGVQAPTPKKKGRTAPLRRPSTHTRKDHPTRRDKKWATPDALGVVDACVWFPRAVSVHGGLRIPHECQWPSLCGRHCARNREATEAKKQILSTPKPWTPKVAFRPSGVLFVCI